MKPKAHKPETVVAILTRLITASLAGSTATQAAEVRWGGWRVIASKAHGTVEACAWPPRGKRVEASARGVPACVREILREDGGA